MHTPCFIYNFITLNENAMSKISFPYENLLKAKSHYLALNRWWEYLWRIKREPWIETFSTDQMRKIIGTPTKCRSSSQLVNISEKFSVSLLWNILMRELYSVDSGGGGTYLLSRSISEINKLINCVVKRKSEWRL